MTSFLLCLEALGSLGAHSRDDPGFGGFNLGRLNGSKETSQMKERDDGAHTLLLIYIYIISNILNSNILHNFIYMQLD